MECLEQVPPFFYPSLLGGSYADSVANDVYKIVSLLDPAKQLVLSHGYHHSGLEGDNSSHLLLTLFQEERTGCSFELNDLHLLLIIKSGQSSLTSRNIPHLHTVETRINFYLLLKTKG